MFAPPTNIRIAQLQATATRLAEEIPLFGRFVAVANDLDEIWRRTPRDRQTFRDELVLRAAQLIEESQSEFELRLSGRGSQLEERLQTVEYLARRRPSERLVEHLLETTINDGLVGDDDLALAEFAARYLDERDLRSVIYYFDRQPPWREVVLRNPKGPFAGLSQYEAYYRLRRLQDIGFFTSDPTNVSKPLASRSFTPEVRSIDNFCTRMNLARIVEVVPDFELAGIQDMETKGTLVAHMRSLCSKAGTLIATTAAVRRHIFDGYQWTLHRDRARYEGSFDSADDAIAAATEGLEKLGLPVKWIQVAV